MIPQCLHLGCIVWVHLQHEALHRVVEVCVPVVDVTEALTTGLVTVPQKGRVVLTSREDGVPRVEEFFGIADINMVLYLRHVVADNGGGMRKPGAPFKRNVFVEGEKTPVMTQTNELWGANLVVVFPEPIDRRHLVNVAVEFGDIVVIIGVVGDSACHVFTDGLLVNGPILHLLLPNFITNEDRLIARLLYCRHWPVVNTEDFQCIYGRMVCFWLFWVCVGGGICMHFKQLVRIARERFQNIIPPLSSIQITFF